MNTITVPKLLITVAIFLSSLLALSQNQYDENLSPEQIQNGLYYQSGPGANNDLNWDYPYGSKITMNAGTYRNFELLTTNYPDGGLKLRQWFPGGNRWSDWRTILVTDKNGHLGLGIDQPQSPLDVYKEIRLSGIKERDNVFLRINRGSSGRDRALISFGQANQYVWHLGLQYRGGSANSDFFISQTSEIRDGNGNYVHTPELAILQNGNVGIGSINPDAKLMVVGDIHANEVRVDLDGIVPPDYVFHNDYELKSIKEVEDYIKKNGHLPNVPSAKEMVGEGVRLKLMSLRLLEKIEELTLYVIELKQENEFQQQEINKLKQNDEK